MTRTMLDCTHANAATVPLDGIQLAALYDTGSPGIAAAPADVARFVNNRIPVVFIDQGYTGSPNLNAAVRDCETGAWTLPRAVDKTGWNVQRPTLYLGYPDTMQLAHDAGWRGDVWLELPGWTRPYPPESMPGINIVAVQHTYLPGYDLSTVYDPAWPLAAAPSVPVWQEDAMRALPVLSYGAFGGDVRTVQGLCNARIGYTGVPALLVLDGIFGQQTRAAVEAVQKAHGVGVDGVVGPQTWPVLMGVA
jgi:hypothetical protein